MIYIFARTVQRAVGYVRSELEPEEERRIGRGEYVILTPFMASRLRGVRFSADDLVIELKGWQDDTAGGMQLAEDYRRMMSKAAQARDVPQIRWR